MNPLDRKPGEGDLDYHRRLVYGKLTDKTLADIDYAELSTYVYGRELNSDSCRKMLYGSKETLQLIDAEKEQRVSPSAIDELEMEKMEVRRERQRLFDQRTEFNKVLRERARQEELNDIITRCVCDGNLPSLEYRHNVIEPSDNDLLVSLNDLHYGAVVDNYWCQYNSDICRSMLRRYIDRIIEIANTHHSENCIVWANGDLISGNIHHTIAVSNKENVIEQVMGVSELLAEFLAELSEHFNAVRFVSVAGNHSRVDQKDRALMRERLDDLPEWYLKARMAGFENVEIGYGAKIDATMYIMDVRGKDYVGVHGDYDPTPAKIQALQAMVGVPVYSVLLGHMHRNMTDHVSGVRVMMAGSFQGMDDYCIQHRIIGKPEQMVCVCDENGVRCHYNIEL